MKTTDNGASLHVEADRLEARIRAAELAGPDVPNAGADAIALVSACAGLTGPLLDMTPKTTPDWPAMTQRELDVFGRWEALCARAAALHKAVIDARRR
jgi:hypothetical protein